MGKDLKNKVDSIRRTLKNNALEVSGTVIELKILDTLKLLIAINNLKFKLN